MAYFNHFSEPFYLAFYPDVNASVNTPRGFISGFEHFTRYGVNEGRTSVSPFFNEGAYLALYPDVANAVASGFFRSGVEHFALSGADEGRFSPIGTFDSETTYLLKYPDVAQAVFQGAFRSGYDHFLQYGQFEGRSPTFFNERDYLIFNPDVAAVVGVPDPVTGVVNFNSGFEHYLTFGQFENRVIFFTGTPGNDVVTSFGETAVEITGVEYITLSAATNPFDYVLGSNGFGEIDTLVGGAQANIFLLALRGNQTNPNPVPLYVGGGNSDYALIKGFERGLDTIQLIGSIDNYIQQTNGVNLGIFTNTGDIVGIVEGVNTPLTTVSTSADGFFSLG
ncbi:hypothetical protein ACE1B6_27385 [Aerosakkonemataceae cyanobacterium BLCC-F154]|uniref:Calcium-binding protein n=1 Tax=Floridaenema fluviatile BLCC-F154 TaxID=3153640 RepID=A0ABV4YKG4_9CYAN